MTPEMPAAADVASRRPLVVELDHGLVRTDLFDETLIEGLRRQPVQTLAALRKLRSGRAALNAYLAANTRLDLRVLPYNQDVIACVTDARAQGRPIHLVSATDAALTNAIAEHLGGFAGAHGSQADRTLTGEQRAQWLVDQFGENGFDYVGGIRSGRRVWASAHHIITVGLGFRLRVVIRRLVRPGGPSALHLSAPRSGVARWIPWARLLRPRQWRAEGVLLVSAWGFSGFPASGLDQNVWLAAAAYAALGLAGRVAAGLWYAQPHREQRELQVRGLNPFADGTLNLRVGLAVSAALLVVGLPGVASTGGWPLLPLALVHASLCAWSVGLGSQRPWLDRLAGAARWSMAALGGLALA